MYHENFNLTSVVTPINPMKFRDLLLQANYPKNKVDFLYEGFSKGFSIGYDGSEGADDICQLEI